MNSCGCGLTVFIIVLEGVLPSSYHPQSNGQSERMGQQMEMAFQCNTSSWSQHLLWVKYANNCLTSSTISLSPFQCTSLFSIQPRKVQDPCKGLPPEGNRPGFLSSQDQGQDPGFQLNTLWVTSETFTSRIQVSPPSATSLTLRQGVLGFSRIVPLACSSSDCLSHCDVISLVLNHCSP